MSVEPSSFDSASTSQVRLKDAYLGGLMEKQRGDPSHQEEEDSEDSDNLEADTLYYKGESQNNKAWVQTLAHGASSSVDQESQKNTEATWDHYLHLSPDTSHYKEAVFSVVRNLWKTTWRSYGRFECEFGYLGNVHEYHSSSSSSSRKRLRHEFEICEELSLENNGAAFQRNRKAG